MYFWQACLYFEKVTAVLAVHSDFADGTRWFLFTLATHTRTVSYADLNGNEEVCSEIVERIKIVICHQRALRTWR